MTPPPPSCPRHYHARAAAKKSLQDWWPNRLDLSVLHRHEDFNAPPSRSARGTKLWLDTAAVVRDVQALLRQSVDWWPADYGHYGGFFVRLSWHAAGTYRATDGRGGAEGGRIRLAPLNSWPDNANLDKAVRLLWPIKRKYGAALSWADLIVLAGTVAMQDMGLQILGFGFGRRDDFTAHDDVDWGPEGEWLADNRHSAAGKTGDDLANPLGAVQMGLIYVNPEGPGGSGDPIAAAHDIRTTFGRMAMNDYETVALIAGGHTFGKAHGAASPDVHVGSNPEGAPMVQQGLGWKNSFGTGHGGDTITSGLEGAWTAHPTRWDNGYLENLFRYEWKQVKSPAGATQWVPTETSTYNMVPDAHDPTQRHAPVMFTTDLALRYDPAYARIAQRFYQNPDEFQTAFAAAWYKLTHKDLGPRTRLQGPLVPAAQLWQDPVPAVTHVLIQTADQRNLKAQILNTGLSIAQLVRTAWASASTFRATDHRGGANGARVRLAPQNAWPVNDPAELAQVLYVLENIQTAFNTAPERVHDKKQVSLADLIVLGGCAAIEAAAANAGYNNNNMQVPFIPGRTDATAEETDVESFEYLKPAADGFRNWVSTDAGGKTEEQLLVDKAYMLQLSAAEMAVLIGGMRVVGANAGASPLGVLTDRPQVLSNDFFVNLLDMDVTWQQEPSSSREVFRGTCSNGTTRWRATKVDLIFGSHSELRAIAEYYACDDAQDVFLQDFVSAWTKVMNNDRYDIDPENPGVNLSGSRPSRSRL